MDVVQQARLRAEARDRTREKDWAAAEALWERLTELNPFDGRIWNGLAEARMTTGDHRGALHAWEQVRSYGVYDDALDAMFPGVVSCLMAGCHLALGDTRAAADELARAMREGFTAFDELADRTSLAALATDPRFAEVFGIVGQDDPTRDEGWRNDLDLLVREARRRRPVPLPEAASARFDNEASRLRNAVPELTDTQVIAGMTRLLALLEDGHAFLTVPPEHEAWSLALPVDFYLFEEGLFVTSANEAYRSLLGAEIRAFDGRPIQEVLTAIDPLIARDNERRPLELAPVFLRRTPLLHAMDLIRTERKVTLTTSDGDVDVHAEPGNVPRGSHFPASSTMVHLHEVRGNPPLYLRNVAAGYWFEHLPEHDLVYFQFNRIGDDPEESIDVFSRRLVEFIEDHEVGRLVVDLRWNGGGNTFLVAPLLRRIAGCRRLDHEGAISMLVGRRTFSAAGNTAKFLQWLAGPNLTVLGEPTGSSLEFIGETVPFRLPYSGLLCNISNLYWQGTTPLDRRSWIAPDVYVPPTFAAYSQGRDPVMEAVLALLS